MEKKGIEVILDKMKERLKMLENAVLERTAHMNIVIGQKEELKHLIVLLEDEMKAPLVIDEQAVVTTQTEKEPN